MEIEEFVSSVLKQIVNGVLDAQKDEKVGEFISAWGDGGHEYAKHPRLSSSARLKSTIVDFDLAVTAENAGSISGGAGLKVAAFGAEIGAKGDGQKSTKDIAVNRIQFAVQILLPERKPKT